LLSPKAQNSAISAKLVVSQTKTPRANVLYALPVLHRMRPEALHATFVETVLFRRFLVKRTVNSVKLDISNRTPTKLSACRASLVKSSHQLGLIAVCFAVLVRNPTRLRADQATFLAMAKPIVCSVALVCSTTCLEKPASLAWRVRSRTWVASRLVSFADQVHSPISKLKISARTAPPVFITTILAELIATSAPQASSHHPLARHRARLVRLDSGAMTLVDRSAHCATWVTSTTS
jgi:hypothetical protein